MDRTKKLKDIKTEVIDGQLFTVYYYTDGTKDYKFVSDSKVNKLVSELMTANDDTTNFNVIKGGKK